MTPLILTLDIGSSSIRAMLFDSHAQAIPDASARIPYGFRTTPDGGVEMDADELFAHCVRAIDEVVERVGAQEIAAVASDCFAMSILGVGADGNAVTPIYTYADSRGAREVAELRARFDENVVHQRVGTLFHTSYLPARLLWLLRERADAFKRAQYWMSFGEYLFFKLLGVRAVSHSVASWTGLLNRETMDWDEELLGALPVSREQLSPITNDKLQITNGRLRKEYAERWRALKDAAWFLTIGDGAAANVGSGCYDSTRIALTVGTSSALRIARERGSTGAREKNLSSSPLPPSTSALPFGLWSYRITRDIELIGGALSEGGNVYAWMLDLLRDLSGRPDLDNELAAMPPDAHGLTFLPFLAGERAPNWNADARAAIIGLTLNTRPLDILRAGMEAVAYRLGMVYDLLRGVAPDAKELIATGGALMKSPTWTQMIADVLNARVIASAESEATSRGCALIALKSLGAIKSFGNVPAALGAAYAPNESRHVIYARALGRQKKWYNLLVKENG